MKRKVKIPFIIMLILAVIIFALLMFLVYKIIFGNSGNLYGKRLDGISEHKIDENLIEEIKTSITSNESVTNFSYILKGKIMYFNITVDSSMEVEAAKKLSNIIVEKADKTVKEYYDIQILIDSENENYPVMGTCNNCSSIIW